MNIIFCSDDLDRRKPDEAYAAEVAALERVGGQYFLVNFDALVNDGDTVKAVRRVPEQAAPALAIYRGWMLKPATYSRLYEALAAKGLRLSAILPPTSIATISLNRIRSSRSGRPSPSRRRSGATWTWTGSWISCSPLGRLRWC